MEVDSRLPVSEDSGDSSPAYNPHESLTEEEGLWLAVEKVLRSIELNQYSIDEASEFMLNLETTSDEIMQEICHLWARFLL
jgi:hypothetical protein